jgi:hypothetical protein
VIPNSRLNGAASLDQVVSTLQHASPPLLLLTGDEEQLSTEIDRLARTTTSPLLSVSAAFGGQLLGQPLQERARIAARTFRALLRRYHGRLALLDRIALLFLPELHLNPLQLLVDASRAAGPLVAAWPGAWDGQTLSYATSGHTEHRLYHSPAVLVENVE